MLNRILIRRHFIMLCWTGLFMLGVGLAYADAPTSCAKPQTIYQVDYSGTCGYEQKDTFALSSSAFVTKIRLWYDTTVSSDNLIATLIKPDGSTINQTTTKGSCTGTWCEGNLVINEALPAGRYSVITLNTPSICRNPSGDSTIVVSGCSESTASNYTIATAANPVAGGSVSCSPNPVASGSNSTCTAKANSGYSFTGWSGSCSGSNSTCTLSNVTEQKSVTASFKQQSTAVTYAITATVSPSAGGSVVCNPNPVASGSSATCTATAASGYAFSGWSGDCLGTSAVCTLSNVTAKKNLNANFVSSPNQSFDVVATATGGDSNLTLNALLTTATQHIGKSGEIYVAANYQNQWFFNNSSGWDSRLAPYFSGTLPSTMTIPVVSGMNLSSLKGLGVYVGYGLNVSDMIGSTRYKNVYTVTGSTVVEPSPSSDGSETDVRTYVNNVLSMTNEAFNGGLLTDQLKVILADVLGKASTCPTVTMNFKLSEISDLQVFLQNLPKPTKIAIDYGAGCVVADTSDKMSGKTELSANSLKIDQVTGKIQADLNVAVNSLAKNNKILSDGNVRIILDLAVANLANGGKLSLDNLGDASSINLLGTANIQLDNYLTPNGKRLKGNIDVNSVNETNGIIALDLTDNNTMHLVLNLASSGTNDEITLNTTKPGTINQYSMIFDSVKYNNKQCPAYPIAGKIIFSTGQKKWTAIFDNRCDGNYVVQ